MCIVRIANNINRNVYMYLNARIFPTTGYARVLLFMFRGRELGGTGTGCLFQFTYCDAEKADMLNEYFSSQSVVNDINKTLPPCTDTNNERNSITTFEQEARDVLDDLNVTPTMWPRPYKPSLTEGKCVRIV